MTDPMPAIWFMALAFGFHIILVNIDMGLAILIPIMKRIGEVRENPLYVTEAKKYMQYFAIIYASAGVFGTAFTIFLLSFFPSFLWLGGVVLLIPFAFAIIFVALRLFSIAAYWYTWNRLKSELHFTLGLVLAATSFLVPFMFRTVFAFLNAPIGVESISPLVINWQLMFLNPTLWPLYLKSIAGALAVTLFLLVSLYAYRLYRDIGDKSINEHFLRKYIHLGMWFFALQFIFGFWYLASLSATTPFKFSNIAGTWFGITPQGTDYSGLFAFKLLLVGYQAFVIFYLLQNVITKNKLDLENQTIQKLFMLLGPIAAITVVTGELLNELSQLPYFVATPQLENLLPMINIYNSINPLAALFDVYVITVFAVVPLLAAFFVLIYYILSGRIKAPETS